LPFKCNLQRYTAVDVARYRWELTGVADDAGSGDDVSAAIDGWALSLA
jgi:hypothetical protein